MPESPCARRRLSGVATLSALTLYCVFPPAAAEPSIGQFELKTLESAPGSYEFQSQNARSWGQPARRIVNGPEGVEYDENAVVRGRYALELEMGLTSTLKMRIGIELEQERVGEPESILQANDFEALSLTELGAEIIAVLAPREGDGAGFGVVAELETPRDRDESSSLTLGPIVEFQSGRWFAAAIPMLVYAFGGEAEAGERVDDKWDLAYAAQLAYTFSESWSLALEGYGTVERLGGSGHATEAAQLFGDFDQHRLGPVLYYSRDLGGAARREPVGEGMLGEAGAESDAASLTIGVGLLQGLNSNTADHTLKLSIEVDF